MSGVPDQGTAAELDAACARMRPVARRFTAAVAARDTDRVQAAAAAVNRIETPDGRSPFAVLAVVLADELVEARAATGSIRVERERCMRLAVSVAQAPIGSLPRRVKLLPAQIARGEPATPTALPVPPAGQ